MKQGVWDNISDKSKGIIITAFKMEDIDFERDHVLPQG